MDLARVEATPGSWAELSKAANALWVPAVPATKEMSSTLSMPACISTLSTLPACHLFVCCALQGRQRALGARHPALGHPPAPLSYEKQTHSQLLLEHLVEQPCLHNPRVVLFS